MRIRLNGASGACIAAFCGVFAISRFDSAQAQSGAPELLDSNLRLRTVVGSLVTPISMAFLGADDLLVLEKDTGQVKRITGGVSSTVLDLGVNNNSERGLLGICAPSGVSRQQRRVSLLDVPQHRGACQPVRAR